MNENPDTTEPRVGSPDGANYAHHDQSLPTPPDPAEVMARAVEWVEQNQTLAMLGAFALGVFIGTMMRD